VAAGDDTAGAAGLLDVATVKPRIRIHRRGGGGLWECFTPGVYLQTVCLGLSPRLAYLDWARFKGGR
jgi:hypothetical protein